MTLPITSPHLSDYLLTIAYSTELSIHNKIVYNYRMISITYPHGLVIGKWNLMKPNVFIYVVLDLKILLVPPTV